VQGPSVITADLIQLPSNEIVNPNHYIATISTSNILEIEFKFEYGTGYRLAANFRRLTIICSLTRFSCQFKSRF
jgi:DNA-directed RNA polymerase subunit alpha